LQDFGFCPRGASRPRLCPWGQHHCPEEQNRHFTGFLLKKETKFDPGSSWKATVWRDIELMDTAWDDVCLKAMDRDEWK